MQTKLSFGARSPAIVALTVAVFMAMTAAPAPALRFSTGGVVQYGGPGPGGDLSFSIESATGFGTWLRRGGHTWDHDMRNANVWGDDFRDGSDAAIGASDAVDLYFFNGHGTCENPPTPGSTDSIVVHNPAGQIDSVKIGASSRWGNGHGKARFILLDASCPMDLVSISTEWFPVFEGLHIATGHSGDLHHDTYNSQSRGPDFGEELVGPDVHHARSVGMAWMDTGLEDVHDDVCAVAIAAGDSFTDAINRVVLENLRSNNPAPKGHFFAVMWTCA